MGFAVTVRDTLLEMDKVEMNMDLTGAAILKVVPLRP